MGTAKTERAANQANRHPDVGNPHPLLSLLESRAVIEAALLPSFWPLLLEAPVGDGHPVLLLPGFLADERSLIALKTLLRSKGYAVETWGLGRNVGFHGRYVKALEQRLRHMHRLAGRKVSLVGWSLGGVFALVAAHLAPASVRSAVTLGSPVTNIAGQSRASPIVKLLYRLVANPLGLSAHALQAGARQLRAGNLPAIPISCLYSLGDGVVPPQEATISGGYERHENIRLAGSHTGLGFNAVALAIVANRLAEPEDAWRRFAPAGLLKAACDIVSAPGAI